MAINTTLLRASRRKKLGNSGAIGAALSSLGTSIMDIHKMNEQKKFAQEGRELDKSQADRQYQLQMDQFLAGQQNNDFNQSLQLRNQVGPGDVNPELGSRLSKFGLADETEMPITGPSIPPEFGMESVQPGPGKFTIPANFLERSKQEADARQAAEAQRQQAEFEATQADRQRKNDAISGLPPHLRSQAITGVDASMPSYQDRQAQEQTDALARIGASRAPNPIEHQWRLEEIAAQGANSRTAQPRVDPNRAQAVEIWKASKPDDLAPPEVRLKWLEEGRLLMGPEVMQYLEQAQAAPADAPADLSALPSMASDPNAGGGWGTTIMDWLRGNKRKASSQYGEMP